MLGFTFSVFPLKCDQAYTNPELNRFLGLLFFILKYLKYEFCFFTASMWKKVSMRSFSFEENENAFV